MYKSTKNYVKGQLIKICDQCGINLNDVQLALKELQEEDNDIIKTGAKEDGTNEVRN